MRPRPRDAEPNAGNGADLEKYSWMQSLQDLVLTVPVPVNTKGSTCEVVITATHLRLGIKGQPPILDGELFEAVMADDCLWSICPGKTSAGEPTKVALTRALACFSRDGCMCFAQQPLRLKAECVRVPACMCVCESVCVCGVCACV